MRRQPNDGVYVDREAIMGAFNKAEMQIVRGVHSSGLEKDEADDGIVHAPLSGGNATPRRCSDLQTTSAELALRFSCS